MNRLRARLSSNSVAAVIATSFLALACGSSAVEPGAAAAAFTEQNAQTSERFKVATWNIRSGMGLHGFDTQSWSSNTLNCSDRSQPLNAWGIGLPQAELSRIRDDQSIVVFAVQEAWNCANPSSINSVLGFKDMSSEQNGTALAARYGFTSPPSYTKVSAEDWIVGASVCLNPACSATMLVFSAHWTGANNTFGATAQRSLDFLKNQPAPHVLLGDLNVYRIDTWNPEVPCTGPDVGARVDAIQRLESAGYVDAWKTTQGSEGWTGMASRNGCGTPNGNLFKRIDYVYTRGLRALSTTRLGRAAPGADSPSDHVMVVAELQINR